jgi:hypothetical protein
MSPPLLKNFEQLQNRFWFGAGCGSTRTHHF